jgi:Mg-chelatase subunit ChlD
MRRLYVERLHSAQPNPQADKELVSLVLDHAKKVIAHPSRPLIMEQESFRRAPFSELALEESIEENPLLSDVDDLLVEHASEKPFSCVALLDASSSMSGEKHLLASIAVAVLLLEVQAKNTSVVVFASDAKPIKNLLVQEEPEETILRFLKSRPRGFTNIARGLEAGLLQLNRQGGKKRKVGLIATDGRTTEGKDPLDVAARYDFLVVLHLHGPGSHLDASKEIAQKGNGICLEVENFDELPRKLYEAVRMLARL